MAEYVEIGQLWKCETCYHRGPHGCVLGGFGCDHGESYRPDYRKLKKADVAPVAHGHWEKYIDQDEFWDSMEFAKCSICGTLHYRAYNYCPNCGARMDGE